MLLEAGESDHLDEVRRAVRHGSSEASWNTTARSGPGFVTSLPSTRMRPEVAAISPSTTDRNVVLPQPEGPTTETNSPSMTVRFTPPSASSRVLVRGWKYSSRMSCASSFGCMRNRALSGWRTPDVDPAFDPTHDLDQRHADGDDGEHADEHLVGLEARARLADHGADPRGGAVDLADHDADHPAADGEAQPRQQERDRARQDDGPEQPPVAGAEARRDLDQARVRGADGGVGVDRERQHREQKDDQDPGADAGADPDDEQRQECDLRRGVECRQQRFHRIGETPVPAGGKAERDAHGNGEGKAEDIAQAAPGEVAPDFARHEEHAEGGL